MNKIKLNKLEENDLSKREMNQIRGGERVCSCGCAYAGEPGGSSTNDNGHANFAIGENGGYSPNVPWTEQTIFG